MAPPFLSFARRQTLALLLWGLPWVACAAAPAALPSVFLEELTSTELRAAVAQGVTTVLVPIGGTEQNGPHMTLGKHNVRVKYLAGQIAQRLGNAVVAPVMAYVPEGSITPPAAHMRFSGTISISDSSFEAILESSAQSFKQHGFRDIVFLGDHGGYQKSEVRAADKLNRAWAAEPRVRALALTAYYEASQSPYIEALRSKGHSDAEIGTHAGLADTAFMLAVDPSQVRSKLLADGRSFSAAEGVYGDPRKATAELGQAAVHSTVERSVQAISQAVQQHANR